ncbi:MAG: hypothetical protein ACOX6U_02895 [Oscillospiraceae bacterium]|jgi:hypothetical protein
MTAPVAEEYSNLETTLKSLMRKDRRLAKKILSTYLNLLPAYPEQPYNQPPVLNPFTKEKLIVPKDTASFEELMPKDEQVLELVERKLAAGECVY